MLIPRIILTITIKINEIKYINTALLNKSLTLCILNKSFHNALPAKYNKYKLNCKLFNIHII